jgi:hypothetical protein
MSWQSLYEPWVLRIIPQRLAKFFHGGVNAMFEINEGISGPEFLLEVFPGHYFARTLEEHGENLEGPLLELDLLATSAQFPPSKINFELSNPDAPRSTGRNLHGGVTIGL